MNTDLCVCEFDECKLYLENPVILPCGATICQNHISLATKDIFSCSSCEEDHLIPKNGFPINKALMKIIENGCHLKFYHKQIFDSIQQFDENLKKHESFDPYGLIYDYFANIRNKIDIHRDQSIDKINKKSDEVLAQLKEREELFKKNVETLKTIDLNQMKEEKIGWISKSRDPFLDTTDLIILKNKIIKNMNKIKGELELLEKESLMKTNIDFLPIDSSIFGHLYISPDMIKYSTKFGQMIPYLSDKGISTIQYDKKSDKLIMAMDDKNIKVLNCENGKLLRSFNQNPVQQILVTKWNTFITCSNKILKIWDLDKYNCLNRINTCDEICSMCLIENDEQLACCSADGTINIWSIKNTFSKVKTFRAHEGPINCLKLSKDSTKLIFATLDYKIKVLDYKAFIFNHVLEVGSSLVISLEFNSQGNLLSGSANGTFVEWDIENGKLLKTAKFDNQINCIRLIADNFVVIGTGSYRNIEICIYDLNSEEILRKFSPPFFNIRELIILQNGNLAALVDNELKTWNFLEDVKK